MSETNTPLNVPYKEKDEAKSLGARWNPGGKHWYVPAGVDVAPFEKWLDGAPAADTATPTTNNATSQPTMTSASLPNNADIDDINAMLRDASEVDDIGGFTPE